jgi:stress response protein YsnF
MGKQEESRKTRWVVPIVAERLRVDRRRGTVGTVRVKKKTGYRDVVIDEPVAHEEVRVRRVPAARFVDGPVPDRYVNGRLIVSILEEVPVVIRRLRVVEELHIERRRTTVRRSQRVTVRRQEALIQRERASRPSLPEQTAARTAGRRRYGGSNA